MHKLFFILSCAFFFGRLTLAFHVRTGDKKNAELLLHFLLVFLQEFGFHFERFNYLIDFRLLCKLKQF